MGRQYKVKYSFWLRPESMEMMASLAALEGTYPTAKVQEAIDAFIEGSDNTDENGYVRVEPYREVAIKDAGVVLTNIGLAFYGLILSGGRWDILYNKKNKTLLLKRGTGYSSKALLNNANIAGHIRGEFKDIFGDCKELKAYRDRDGILFRRDCCAEC